MSTPIPVINSVTPSSGPTAGGTSVTITGQNFRNGCRVRVGGVDSPQVTFINSTQVIAVTPAGTAGPATVRVINPNQQTPGIAQDAFTYVNAPPPPTPPVPTVTSVQPPSGPTSGGTQVTITGQNFVLGCQAKFGGTDAQTTFISSSVPVRPGDRSRSRSRARVARAE
ncbi:MAG TPA: IPT/TIG domain-containing protein [Pyrinomonadaceae bacterium]